MLACMMWLAWCAWCGWCGCHCVMSYLIVCLSAVCALCAVCAVCMDGCEVGLCVVGGLSGSFVAFGIKERENGSRGEGPVCGRREVM